MTTKFKCSYNFLTSKHEGNFPLCYWDSEKIPLYGFEEVKCYLQLYPVGKNSESVGNVGAYVYFERLNKLDCFMLVDMTIRVGTKQQQALQLIVGDHKDAGCEFGSGRGWHSFCPSTLVMTQQNISVGYEITIHQAVTISGSQKITTTPMGTREHDYTSGATLDFTKK